jgi:sphingolipid C9-methyltransferase
MNKYIFPGADASTPLGWFVDSLESAGFEVKSIDTIGVHYSATIWRWYRNWMSNKSQIIAKYGDRYSISKQHSKCRWFRIWEYFLAYSTIISRQGSATCYQIVLHKVNLFVRSKPISRILMPSIVLMALPRSMD